MDCKRLSGYSRHVASVLVDSEQSQGLVQLECHNIRSAAVIRPRTRSTKFFLGVGGLFVKDLYNPSTQFPMLISPRLPVSRLGISFTFRT